MSSIEAKPAGDVVDVTLVLDTNAYTSGDVLAIPAEVAGMVRLPGGVAELVSVTVLDEDDQGTAFDLVFFNASASLGTINAAVSISDADARKEIGRVSIAAADFIDNGGSRSANLRNVGLLLKTTALVRSLWIGAIARGAPTHSASGIRLKLGLAWG